MPEQHRRRIFGLDLRIAPLRLAGDALDLAEQIARDIDDMDAEIENDEALLGIEVRLSLVDVVAGAEADARPRWLADSLGVDDRFHFLQRRLKAEILMHSEKEAGLVCDIDDFPNIGNAGCK